MQFEWYEHDGQLVILEVSSETRGGQTIWCACVADDPTIRSIAPEPALAVRAVKDRVAAIASAKQPRVLVVDDDEHTLEVMRLIMERDGLKVEVATNAIEALVRLGREVFDIVLTDMHMPGLDGATFVRRLRATPNTANMAVVGMTAGTAAQVRAMGEAGADAVLAKPYRPDAVTQLLRDTLKRRLSPRAGRRL